MIMLKMKNEMPQACPHAFFPKNCPGNKQLILHGIVFGMKYL